MHGDVGEWDHGKKRVAQPVCKGGLAVPCIFTKLQAFDVLHVVDLLFVENDAKWKYFAVYFAGYALHKWKPALASDLIPHSGGIPPFYTEVLTNFKLMFCEIMGEEMSVLRASATRGVYSRFLARKKGVPLVEQKLLRLGSDFLAIWENVSNAFVCPDRRNLNWRIVHDVLPVNEKLHRQQSFVSPLCPLCGVGLESLQHIFWGCPVIIPVLNRVEVIIAGLLNRPNIILTVNEVVYLLVPPCNREVKSVILEVVSLFKHGYCVWKGRNEVKKEGRNRSGGDILSSFLALLGFRGKTDLYRFTVETFSRYWTVNNAIFQERNEEFQYQLSP